MFLRTHTRNYFRMHHSTHNELVDLCKEFTTREHQLKKCRVKKTEFAILSCLINQCACVHICDLCKAINTSA